VVGRHPKLDGAAAHVGPGVEQEAKFFPDGGRIAYLGSYDGQVAVYVMPSHGGMPEQITFDQQQVDDIEGFSADGKRLSIAYITTPVIADSLEWVDIATHKFQPLKFETASYSSLAANNHVALTRIRRARQAWFGYRGAVARSEVGEPSGIN